MSYQRATFGVWLKIDARELAAPQPAEMRDVGDGVRVTGGEFGPTEDAVEHRERPLRLGLKAGNSKRNLPLEEADLAERGTDAGHMEEHLFERASSSEDIRGNESPGLRQGTPELRQTR